MALKTVFPFTRVHEPLRVNIDIQGGKIVEASIDAMLFRGFELMAAGRDPRDMPLFMQRICGICSSAHSIAAALCQRQAFGVEPTPNGQLLENLIFAADLIQNHLRHFYILVLYDYIKGPDYPPFVPRNKSADYRLPKNKNDEILAHAEQGTNMAARAHEAMAVFGAKAPHQQTIMATGVTEQATSERLMAYRNIIREVAGWIENVHLADVQTIAEYYKDYYSIGTGYGNFMSFGMFPIPVRGGRALPAGISINRGGVEHIAIDKITEEVRYSRYKDNMQSRSPSVGLTHPYPDKPEAYTWVKAPRYQGLPVESGPLARGWISGEYRRGVSTMDRIVARALEVLKVCRIALEFVDQVIPGAPTIRSYTPSAQGEGFGVVDAMRGALGHWFSVKDYKVVHYQIVTPTAWNFSPRDEKGQRGPVEEALIGTPVSDPESLVEAGRVIRSFDPCFTCAVHVINDPKASNFKA